MGKTSTGKLASGIMEFLTICDQCQKPRSEGRHTKCSRIRQRIHAAKNERQNISGSTSGGAQ